MTPLERSALSRDDAEYGMRYFKSQCKVPKDPHNSAELTASWGTRETFIAIFTTNLPMIFPLLKNWFAPFLSSTIGSSNSKPQKPPPGSDFRTIGGGLGDGGLGVARISRVAPHKVRHNITDLTFDNESEEHILNGEDLRLEHIQGATSQQQGKDVIVVTGQFNVKSEHRSNTQSKESFQVM
ncbi:unnamed protein product [Alternaria alternata]